MNTVFFGKGAQSTSATGYVISGTNGQATNNVGGDITVRGGRGNGTGAGISGNIILQTGKSGVGFHVFTDRVTIFADGRAEWLGIITASAPAVSAASSGAIFYDSTLQKFRASQNGAAYIDLIGVSGTVAPTQGGTGITTYTTGDTIYASAANVLSIRAIGTEGQVYTVTSGVPTWETPAATTSNISNFNVTTSTASVVNTIAETTVTGFGVGTYTLGASAAIVGTVIRVNWSGVVRTTSTPTLEIKFKIGGGTFTLGAIVMPDTATLDMPVSGYFIATVRIIGASATVAGHGAITVNTSATTLTPQTHLERDAGFTGTTDTTIDNTLSMTVQWGTASTNNRVAFEQITMDVVN